MIRGKYKSIQLNNNNLKGRENHSGTVLLTENLIAGQRWLKEDNCYVIATILATYNAF
jgi:hypothetical protein